MEVAENFNKEEIQMQTTQCTKVGDNGEVITVSITTEESHQAEVLGKSLQIFLNSCESTALPNCIEFFPHKVS